MVALRGWVQTLSSLLMPRLASERPPMGQKIQSYLPIGTLRRKSLKENHRWIMTTDTIGRGDQPMLPRGIRGDSRRHQRGITRAWVRAKEGLGLARGSRARLWVGPFPWARAEHLRRSELGWGTSGDRCFPAQPSLRGHDRPEAGSPESAMEVGGDTRKVQASFYWQAAIFCPQVNLGYTKSSPFHNRICDWKICLQYMKIHEDYRALHLKIVRASWWRWKRRVKKLA